MTLVHFDTPMTRFLRGAPAANRPAHLFVKATSAIAAWRRHREEQRALDAMPLDLRKDLGWPAGDIRR